MTKTKSRQTPDTVLEKAAAWFAKRDAGVFSSTDQQALDAWIAADPAHATAWRRLDRLWAGLDGAPPAMRSGARERVAAWRSRQTRRRKRMAGAAAAAALSLAMILPLTDLPIRLRADAMTTTGERREVRLADGSIVHLNSGSAIAIDYSESRRTVRLLTGEAAFDVAPDRQRPFVVEADGGSATALGTRYIVRRLDEGARVTVTHHSVAVRSRVDAPPVTVHEGQSVRYVDGHMSPILASDMSADTAWLRGRMVFRNLPLGEVVRGIARYHPGLIRVLDADVARRPISGVFSIDDPVGAIDSIERSFGLHSTRLTDRVILITR